MAEPVSAIADVDVVRRHRAILDARPELRSVYAEWFKDLLDCVHGLGPIVEIGAGPGLFRQYCPRLVTTDVLVGDGVDVACDAHQLPFPSASIGALLLVDTLHHMARPLEFVGEARRVLKAQGRLAMVEPWITPLSFLLYRFLHHEDCRLGVDLTRPFGGDRKRAFDGNAAIPFLLFRHLMRDGQWRLIRGEAFIGLPYLVSFGFKSTRRVPFVLIDLARGCERLLRPLRKLAATRTLLVWEKAW